MSPRAYSWLLVGLLWVVAALNYLDRQVLFSMLPLIRAYIPASDFQLGLLATAFLWVYGFLSPLGGYAADRYGARVVILASLAVWSAVTFLTGHTTTYPQLFAARSLMGISEAFYLPAALALIAAHHGPATRSLATGLHQSGLYLGIVLGGAGGGWLGERHGWHAVFILLGAVGVVYAAVLFFLLRNSSPTPASDTRLHWRGLLSSRSFGLITGVNALTGVAYWCVYTWLPLYLYERFQMTLTGAGFSATFYIQAASFAGILLGGALADRWSRTQPRARIITQALGLAAAGPFLFLAGWTSTAGILIAALVLFGLGRGFYDCNLMPVVCDIVEPEVRATAYGILNLTSCIAGGVMAAAGGALKGLIGLGGALQLSGGLLVLAAVTLSTLKVKRA